ncbi:MAG: hypothetical protein J3Q66DRAFT_331087 [Benniella sp.]|nr:MAG: hypothetical protein J3Q66DRAFT_331087 [Benniella sp.]
MFKHVYPHWHKSAQRCLFFIAAILCITLPVAYGRHHISSATLGSVLGIFFGFWLAFSLIVRFCVPSPEFESSLPVYTHSPIPTPVTFHSPARSDAVPSAPAIRLHPPSSGGGASVTPSESAVVVTKGARFAQDPVAATDHHNNNEGLSPPSRGVTFQTRPRGNTADSTNSTAYPTFAAYRQAQHGNFEAMAQRVKRAFALSQQQQRQQQQQREEEEEAAELKRQQLEQESQQEKEAQELKVRSIHSRTPSSTSTLRGSALSPASGTRSRSASAASMIGDFAERIKNGSFFKRSPSANVVPTVASLASSSSSGTGSDGEDVTESSNTRGNVLRITTEQELLATDRIESPSGIALVVTPSEDDHPHADGVTIASAPTTTTQPVNMAHTTITIPSDAPARPDFSRSSTRESSPLVGSD